jgi:mono/diheme cytochrome c family protein
LRQVAIVWSLFFSPFLHAHAEPEPIFVFKDRGSEVKRLTLRDLQRLVPAQSITILEPHEKKKIAYRGFSFSRVMDSVYGETWKQREEMLVTCLDGYQPSIAVNRLVQFPAYLVYEREDKKSFSVVNRIQGGYTVSLGPIYLVWDNLKAPELLKEGAMTWPYQITTFDFIRFSDRFPKMAPPAKANARAHQGFAVFRRECMACHTVNGEGGAKGVELNFPASVTEYMQPEWLRRWIVDPSSVRFGSSMPSFNQQREEWKTDLEDLIVYLTEMAKNKKSPQ